MMDAKEALKELEDLTVDYGDRNEEQIARLDEAIDMAMDALRNLPNRLRQAMDTISRKSAVDDWMEKCMTCKHVYQRIDDVDTLYCRCRKGCKYEEVKVRRSNHDPQIHDG